MVVDTIEGSDADALVLGGGLYVKATLASTRLNLRLGLHVISLYSTSHVNQCVMVSGIRSPHLGHRIRQGLRE